MVATVSVTETEQQTSEGIPLMDVARDIATLGTGSLLAGVINALLVFVIPRLVSVEDYGYWRLFALYAGYVGLAHLGFADGALLRWAGRPFAEFHHELLPSLKFVFWQHVLLLAPLCVLLGVVLHGQLRFAAIAIAACALIFNAVTLLQFSLQSARLFRPVAVSTVAVPALFLGFALLWKLRWPPSYREVISSYSLAWLVTLGFLLGRTRPWQGARRPVEYSLVRSCLLAGWPIVLANTGVGLILTADRLAVSWAATIQDFAQYSLAASAMAVPITTVHVCSKVFFSHFAWLTAEGRKKIYGVASWALLTVWCLLLPYYFALDVFVKRFLPNYVPSLGVARVLLLGIPFLAGIQILHMSFAYLNDRQRHFLWQTLGVLIVSLGVASLVAFGTSSLKRVAATQVVILGLWWLFNEWTLRDLTGQSLGDWMKFAGVYTLAGVSYWLTSRPGVNVVGSVRVYYASAAIVAVIWCRDEVKVLFRELMGRRTPAVE
jgi:O-antigen/teichoic acid export membrane protein